jgi:hypothetical protein
VAQIAAGGLEGSLPFFRFAATDLRPVVFQQGIDQFAARFLPELGYFPEIANNLSTGIHRLSICFRIVFFVGPDAAR